MEHKDDADWVEHCMMMEVDGTRQRKNWLDGLSFGIQIVSVGFVIVIRGKYISST